MPVGPAIRRMFGPYERQVSELYRSIYVNLDELVARIKVWKPSAGSILEIGCGEGAVTERLTAAYPDTLVTAIDITPRLGRLFKEPPGRVEFIQTGVQNLIMERPKRFDLLVMADMFHHVPIPLRGDLLQAARRALAPGGVFIFKDWERSFTPIHWMCHAADRWITGDLVSYLSEEEMRLQLDLVFGADAIKMKARIAPWRNNLVFLVQG